ncbi:hypothetical protein KW782_03870 [Candidatus Parcubacteria bacterium]|nr:hypothetical protein [Candidatus Parcubacteria bacterium]
MITNINDVRSGRDLEEYVFLRSNSLAQHQRNLASKILNFREAYEAAKKDQGPDWDPLNPPTEPAKRIVEAVKTEIRLIKRELHPVVPIYRLIGKISDSMHKTDGSIEYGRRRVFIDVSMRRKTVAPDIYLVTHWDIMGGELEEIAVKIAHDILNQEKRSMLAGFAWDMNSEDATL